MLETISNWIFGVSAAIAETAGAAAPAAAPAADAAAASTGTVAEAGIGALISPILSMVLLFAVFYFLLIRPQRKKDKKVKDMLKALKVGDRICTIGGIYATIVSIKDDTFTLSVGQDNVKLVVARWAIRNVEEVSIENDAEALN